MIHTAAPSKIMTLDELCRTLNATRNGQKVVHCHGVFDLLHVGHIKHLQAARKLGDVLIVTVTPDRFVNKGPGRPAFGEQLRLEALAALACVDFVALNDQPSAVEAIRRLRPNIFVKGSEFTDRRADQTGHITAEEQAVRSVGGELALTGEVTFSSSNLINRHLGGLPEDTRRYLEGFARRYPTDDVIRYLVEAHRLSVLVIGEAIIDEYQYCTAIGKSSKEPVLVVKQKSVEKFAGGILAVANHVAGFAGRTELVSLVGADDAHLDLIAEKLRPGVKANLVRRDWGPTIVKRRFIDDYYFQKLFEVYECNDAKLSPPEEERLRRAIDATIDGADVVIVVDFGHGMMSTAAIERVCRRAKFLVVNAQSNAGNLGYHAVSKYRRADLVCIAENEMRLEARDRDGDLRPMVGALSEKLGSRRVVVTRGSHGCLCFDAQGGFVEVPAVADRVADRMGAGDTFISIAGLCAAQEAPLEVLGLIGNAAAAEAVATVGHRRYLERVALTRHIQCLLK